MRAESFSFRPAPLRAQVTYRLEPGLLHGPHGTLELSNVTRAALVDHVIRGQRMRRLDLYTGKRVVHIGLNRDASLPVTDSDRAAHHALCRALATHLAENTPDLPVAIGETGGARWAMFAIGASSLLFSLGILIAAAVSGISGDRMAAAALPMLMLAGLGVLLIQGNAPWKKQPTLPATLLPAMIDALDPPTND
ncbi:hypothetical protein VK792_13280 [Mesobacterium sp. TK19101]|uniref:Uncharacterized protein n=1 Tax=Mesobacterium hydrothermale TaxID=3111907 RepID=A0ABU6HIH3_9RHOB|nr:hypothetical protein [Mesobacterium sp. TK19101]MEC3862260.1 hypothetical protein [Mesobacterium sp. TK19101]